MGPGDFEDNDIGDDWQLQYPYIGLQDFDCERPSNKIERANCICTGSAYNRSNLREGEYHAWISSVQGPIGQFCGVDARENVSDPLNSSQNTMPLYLQDGTQVAGELAHLWIGSGSSMLHAININEYTTDEVWTGTFNTGYCANGPDTTCLGVPGYMNPWAEGSTSNTGVYGSASSISGWTNVNTRECWRPSRLYCIWYDEVFPASWLEVMP
jgi:hypothetical protein